MYIAEFLRRRKSSMSRLAKLARMTPGELWGRLLQGLQSQREWVKSVAEGPSEMGDDVFLVRGLEGGAERLRNKPTELWQSFQDRARNAPFEGLNLPRETLRVLRKVCPEELERTVHRADGIVTGEVTFLGCRVPLSRPVEWHLEPVTGRRLPLHHWTRIDHLDPQVAGEFKVVWELNRHQYFLALGQAYALTDDQKYASTFRDHLTSWMDDNPPGWGINWSSSLELSYRAIAWIWSLHLFRDSPLITGAFFVRCLKFLYLQGRHIERHLSTFFSPNTHLTGEALGLLYLGVFFPELSPAGRWRQLGARILHEQLPVQVLDDGVYFEHASAYGGYTLDIYLHADILLAHLGTPFPSNLRSRLLRALEHLRHLVRPDGMIPLWGDDDGGRLLPLTPRAATDFTDTLCTGAYLFERGDLLSSSTHPTTESILLLGSRILTQKLIRRDPGTGSEAFPKGGVYVLRDGWGADSSYTMISSGPHGSIGGGHAHADALSIEVTLRGRPLVIDPGTFTYRRDMELRNELRSAWAHNSIVIDEIPFAVPADGPFEWRTSTDASVEHFCFHDDFDFLRAVLNHPVPGRPAVRHARSLFFIHNGCLIVWDQVEGDGLHRIDLRFHLAPDWQVDPVGNNADCVGKDGRRVTFHFFGSRDAQLDTFETLVSPGYGEVTPSHGVRWRQEAMGSQQVITVISPDSRERVVDQIPAPEAALGLSIEGRDFKDILLLGLDGRTTLGEGLGPKAVEIEGEAALLWIHRSHRTPLPRVSALLVRRLDINGVALVTGEEFIESARWALP